MNSTMLVMASIATAGYTISHAVLGESRLIGPLAATMRGIMADDYGRTVLRLAWHFTTLLLMLVALFLYFAATRPAAVDSRMVIVLGISFLLSAVVDVIATRGRHDAWIPLSGISALILFA